METTSRYMKSKGTLRLLLLALLLLLLVILLLASARAGGGRAFDPKRDIVQYWAAGHLLLAGGNPYMPSPEELRSLPQASIWIQDTLVITWSLPWTLFFVIPLGFLDYVAASLLYALLTVVLVIACASVLWRLYGGPAKRQWLALLVAFSFFPTLGALAVGQISPLILTGLVGFLFFARRKEWWLAGACSVLVAIKPHLLYLFWLALLLWIVRQRRWPVLGGGLLAGAVATAIPVLINPSVLGYYLDNWASRPPGQWATPTLGTLLRMLSSKPLAVNDSLWPLFVPILLGLLWFIPHWWRHRDAWDWAEQTPLLLLVSFVTAPFGWVLDQVVLLPAAIQAAVWVLHEARPRVRTAALIGYLAINVPPWLMAMRRTDQFWYIWIAPALLLGYLLLRRETGQGETTSPHLMPGRLR
ncbi:MAG: DUF2029 domain-containing protein [Anaerolineae bacterium]|nr:DUF2029 domain-containing protein [Anaerolineae bacterium]